MRGDYNHPIMVIVTLYTKADCPLCRRAERVILSLQEELGFRFERQDITQDVMLYERYRFDIPVIAIDGQERFRHRVGKDELRAALGSTSRPQRP